MHAYPLYLAAAMSGAALCYQLAIGLWQRLRSRGLSIPRTQVLRWLAVATGIAIATIAYLALPWFVVREAIAAGSDVSVQAGGRDTPFFGGGWSNAYIDVLTFRVSTAAANRRSFNRQ